MRSFYSFSLSVCVYSRIYVGCHQQLLQANDKELHWPRGRIDRELCVVVVLTARHTEQQCGIYSSVTTKEKKEYSNNTAIEKEVCGALRVCTETL